MMPLNRLQVCQARHYLLSQEAGGLLSPLLVLPVVVDQYQQTTEATDVAV